MRNLLEEKIIIYIYMRELLRKYEKHRKKILAQKKEYYYKNRDDREFMEKKRLIRRNYRRGHREEINQKLRERRKEDAKFRLDSNIRSAVRKVLKGKKNGRRWETLVGYTCQDLMKHLENQFEPWMTWDNYGKWEVDHRKPISLFHYTFPGDPEFKECWALKNLQPMEKIENMGKGNKYEE